jgi:hypothetical protein
MISEKLAAEAAAGCPHRTPAPGESHLLTADPRPDGNPPIAPVTQP